MPAGAAVKADGYGLGARETVEALIEAGCRDFFVSTWAEAEQLGNLAGERQPRGAPRRRPGRCRGGAANRARGRASTPLEQVARWKEIAPDRACDVMIDTGMNRLGLAADRDRRARRSHDRHAAQPSRLRRRGQRHSTRCSWSASGPSRSAVPAKRYSMANRAGICLGRDYSFDLVRPGLSLYGGVPRAKPKDTSARSRGWRRRSSSGA